MAKQPNPFDFDPAKFFADFDPTKVFSAFDPAKMMSDFNKAAGDMAVPAVDVTPFLDIQRRNLEALVSANKLAAEGMQAVYMRQAELQKQVAEELGNAVGGLTKAQSPQESVAAQADLMKDAFERTLGSMRELTDMLSKSNAEALETVNKRFTESLSEFKDEVVKTK